MTTALYKLCPECSAQLDMKVTPWEEFGPDGLPTERSILVVTATCEPCRLVVVEDDNGSRVIPLVDESDREIPFVAAIEKAGR